MYQYLETVGLKAEFLLFKCSLVALCKIQFKVPVCAVGWFVITRQNGVFPYVHIQGVRYLNCTLSVGWR